MAGRLVNVGFSGTYTDKGAEAGATALIGKRSDSHKGSLHLEIQSYRFPLCTKPSRKNWFIARVPNVCTQDGTILVP
jgi:hypothetical protein